MGSSSRLRLTTAFSLLLIFAVALVVLGSTKLTTLAADTSLKLSPKTEHSSAAQASSCGVWNVVPSPNIGTGQNQLLGVTAISATNVWAVGDSTNSLGYDQTLTEQWNGTNWSVVSSPNSGIGYNYLEGVAAVSANNIWAVGAYPYNSYYQPLIEQWNGTSWNVVSSPIIGTDGSVLDGVARVPGSSKVWAVGDEVTSNGIVQTLIERWNGTSWNVVSSPNVGSYANYLEGVTAVSANNIWAVGWYEKSMNGPIQSLLERWNGTSWNVVSNPNPAAGAD